MPWIKSSIGSLINLDRVCLVSCTPKDDSLEVKYTLDSHHSIVDTIPNMTYEKFMEKLCPVVGIDM